MSLVYHGDMTMTPDPPLHTLGREYPEITIAEAAYLGDVSPRTIRRYIDQGCFTRRNYPRGYRRVALLPLPEVAAYFDYPLAEASGLIAEYRRQHPLPVTP